VSGLRDRRDVHLLRNWKLVARDMAYAAGVRAKSIVQPGDALAFLGGDRTPVVILPGVFETWNFMVPMSTRLAELGHPVHLLAELGVNRRSIRETAVLAERYLIEHDLRGVILVAHSKGGLIGKQMMLVDDVVEQRIDRLVAVATPFSGSSFARWMPLTALRAFSPRDKELLRLSSESSVNARITSVYPEWDAHVPEGSYLEGATNVEVPVRGHFQSLVQPASLDAVVAAVEAADVSETGGSAE
jgi:pimeloyl-ACP methyl ester carboxylesterase